MKCVSKWRDEVVFSLSARLCCWKEAVDNRRDRVFWTGKCDAASNSSCLALEVKRRWRTWYWKLGYGRGKCSSSLLSLVWQRYAATANLLGMYDVEKPPTLLYSPTRAVAGSNPSTIYPQKKNSRYAEKRIRPRIWTLNNSPKRNLEPCLRRT